MTISSARRWWALGALVLAMLTIGLDTTVLSVALPNLATDLHASNSELQWFTDAYTLVLAAVLLPAGMLGDRFGRKRLLIAALLLFGVASAASAYSQSSGQLIAARAVLGLGAAFMMPLSMAVLPVLFPPAERGKAIAIWVTSTAVGLPLGPILGGWLLDNFWWGSVFLINVPLVIIGVIVVAWLIPESRSTQRRGLDPVGMVGSSVGLLGVTYGCIAAGEKGWTNAEALSTLLAGLVLLGAFVLWERRIRQPLLDLALFRSPSFTWGTLLSVMINFSMFGLLFAMPQFFRAVGGTDALGSGVRLLPMIGGLIVGTRIVERLVDRTGAKATVAVGFTIVAAGLAMGALTGVHTGYGYASIWIAALGVGMGFVMPTAMNAAMGTLTAERSGAGSAMMQSMRQVGGTIGVAVLGTVLASAYRGQLDLAGLPPAAAHAVRDNAQSGVAVAQQAHSPALLESIRSAFVHGMDVMLWASCGIAVVAVVLAVLFLPRASQVGPVRAERAESEYETV
jgi:EmrB/QacA subfamily drug resistance transporter